MIVYFFKLREKSATFTFSGAIGVCIEKRAIQAHLRVYASLCDNLIERWRSAKCAIDSLTEPEARSASRGRNKRIAVETLMTESHQPSPQMLHL